MSTPKTESESNESPITINPKALATIFKEVGMAGFIVITLVVMFFVAATPAQKEKFIDRFILFEPDQTNSFSISYVIIVLITFIIIQSYFHRKENKKLKEEIERLSEFKSTTQAKTTGKQLRSSR